MFRLLLTAIHDTNVNMLMCTSLFENLLCCFKNSQSYVNMNKYIGRVLEMAMKGAMLAIVSLAQNNTIDTVLTILMQN